MALCLKNAITSGEFNHLERKYMLEIKNLVYTVTDPKTGKENRIIDDISLTIDERFVAITGPNGSGKSTLAKLIAGIAFFFFKINLFIHLFHCTRS